MQQHVPAHVREGHAGHDDQAADQKAFGPGLQDEAHRVPGLFDDEHHAGFTEALRRNGAQVVVSSREESQGMKSPSVAVCHLATTRGEHETGCSTHGGSSARQEVQSNVVLKAKRQGQAMILAQKAWQGQASMIVAGARQADRGVATFCWRIASSSYVPGSTVLLTPALQACG